MFSTIYKYEIKYWLQQPATYLYAFFLCLLPMAQAAEWGGVFKDTYQIEEVAKIVNSPIGILTIFNKFTILIFFLLPIIFGKSIQRDFQHSVHSVLYSYPLTRGEYLTAKFLSASTIVLALLGCMGLGIFLGARFPGHLPTLVGTFQPTAYLTIYGIYLLPNILLLGSLVLLVVTRTRNIYAGFISILFLFFLQIIVGALLPQGGSLWSTLLDPFGQNVTKYFTQHWTIIEQNKFALPITSWLIYNRLLWGSVTLILLLISLISFQFHQEPSFSFFKKRVVSKRIPKQIRGIRKVVLPIIQFDHSILYQIKSVWRLAIFELKYLLKSGLFASVVLAGIGVVLFKQAELNPPYGYETLPVTWKMLQFPLHNFSGTINILTFLYAGLLIHRSRMTKMAGLVHSTSIPNWVLLFSKAVCLLLMQAILLGLILVGGIIVQTVQGFYTYELQHYVMELYGIHWIHFTLWACLAVFIQTLFTNPYLGFFLLLIGMIGIAHLHLIGLEHLVFKYNWSPLTDFSDLLGYGDSLAPYFLYKGYWSLFGILLLIVSYGFWQRELTDSFQQRMAIAWQRMKGRLSIAMGIITISFVVMGSSLWYTDQVATTHLTSLDRQRIKKNMQPMAARYTAFPQPRIQSVKIELDLFPADRNFHANGKYTLVNKTNETIDTLLVVSDLFLDTKYQFNQPTQSIFKDTTLVIYGIPAYLEVVHLSQPLAPKDSLTFTFNMSSPPTTFLHKHTPVKVNGTALANILFPRFGYWEDQPLLSPSDKHSHQHMYESKDADWVDFETTVSTDIGQKAIAFGDLQKQWTKNDRAYSYYKTTQKIPFYTCFFSANYAIHRDTWNETELAIYHHPSHSYNVAEMIKGMKAALAYNTKYFGPYPLQQARIVEIPKTYGRMAKAFAGTIPISESLGFIASIDSLNSQSANTPFFTAVHEMTHQWWMHQVNPANALGAEMILESTCQYVALKCIEQAFGKDKLLGFLKNELNWYLKDRTRDRSGEDPLLYNQGQAYLKYAKGTLAFYSISEAIGEATFNRALHNFYIKYRLQEAPFGTSQDFLQEIKQVTPDSLQYLVTDLLEHITFYKNTIQDATVKLNNTDYQINLSFLIKKERLASNGQAINSSLPLKDYVEIGVYNEAGDVLHLQLFKIEAMTNQLTILVPSKPSTIIIDPYYKLIDINRTDNVFILQR